MAAFDVTTRREEHKLRSLLGLCMKIKQRDPDVAAELIASVPVAVEAVWRLGDSDYDALGDLPRR